MGPTFPTDNKSISLKNVVLFGAARQPAPSSDDGVLFCAFVRHSASRTPSLLFPEAVGFFSQQSKLELCV
jgi:hypothetical protein